MTDERNDNTVAITLIILAVAVASLIKAIGRWRAARRNDAILDGAVRRSQAWDKYAADRHAAVDRFLQIADGRP